MKAFHIRDAVDGDLAAINDIYNHYVLHATCTYQTAPETLEDRGRWFAARGLEHPVLVAEAGDEVLGWGALSRYHPRQGYRHTVDNSVYVRHDQHGRGIGRALLAELIDRARRAGHHAIVATIDAEQAVSLALHRRAGFVESGRLRQVGHKFDRWLDVVYLELLL